MAAFYKRLLITIILITAFAGRIAIYAIPMFKVSQQIVKESSSKSEKSEANENDQPLEEKIKLEDLNLNDIVNIDFLSIADSKTKLFAATFDLPKSDLQTLEYPPK